MATDQLINKAQGDAIISGLTAIKNAINDQPVPTQVEDVVADAFDVGVSYVPGDYCIYENKLYVCDVAHHGAWDGNDFTLTTVGAVLEGLNGALSNTNTNVNKKIGFLDTANKQTFVTGANQWLVTVDCWVNVMLQGSDASEKYVQVNGVTVASTSSTLLRVMIPVKTGQSISVGGGTSYLEKYIPFL